MNGHRSIPTIEADLFDANAGLMDIEHQKAVRRKAFEDSLKEEFREQNAALVTKADRLQQELRDAKAATASHPLEGKMVIGSETHHSRSYYGRGRTITLRGVVKIVRAYEDMPTPNRQTLGHRQPQFGEAFIQRLNAKGEPLNSWIILDNSGSLPQRWYVAEEVTA